LDYYSYQSRTKTKLASDPVAQTENLIQVHLLLAFDDKTPSFAV